MSLKSRNRAKLLRDLRDFLAAGGKIQKIPAGVSGERISITYYDTKTGKLRKVSNRA